MTTDYKTNPEYIKARRRGIRFGISALLSFWYIVAIFLLLINVIGKNALFFLLSSPMLGIAFAVICLFFSIKNRNIALKIRYGNSDGVAPTDEKPFEFVDNAPLPK